MHRPKIFTAHSIRSFRASTTWVWITDFHWSDAELPLSSAINVLESSDMYE